MGCLALRRTLESWLSDLQSAISFSALCSLKLDTEIIVDTTKHAFMTYVHAQTGILGTYSVYRLVQFAAVNLTLRSHSRLF
jgi:hypothetical protein